VRVQVPVCGRRAATVESKQASGDAEADDKSMLRKDLMARLGEGTKRHMDLFSLECARG